MAGGEVPWMTPGHLVEIANPADVDLTLALGSLADADLDPSYPS